MAEFVYPKRPPFFALKFIRLMTKNCVANQHGSQVFTLLAVIVSTEDSAKYQRPVTYYNCQLMPLIGVESEDTLARVRAKAVASGWLSYKPGRRNTPGQYFVTVPPIAEGYSDSPVDESPDELTALSSAPMRTQSRSVCGRNRDESADNVRNLLPIPVPDPNTPPSEESGSPKSTRRNPKPKSAGEESEAFRQFWNQYPRKVAKGAASKAFAKIDPSPELLEQMLVAIAEQARSDEQWRRDDGRYIPHPATWLNGRRWEDAPMVKPDPAPKPKLTPENCHPPPGTIYPPMDFPTPAPRNVK